MEILNRKATFDYFSSKYDFFNIIDGAIVSGYEGVKKPDPQIFKLILKRVQVVSQLYHEFVLIHRSKNQHLLS